MPDVPIVATLVLLLLHVPPLVTSLNVWLDPAQVFNAPKIDEGNGFTVTIATVEFIVVVVGIQPTVHI